jgi:hypothetical protein
VQKFIESLNYDTNIVLDLSGLFLSQAVRERDQIRDNAFLRQPVAELDAIAMNQAVCMHPAAPENEAEGIRTEPYWSRGVQASIRTPGRLETPAALRAETRRCRARIHAAKEGAAWVKAQLLNRQPNTPMSSCRTRSGIHSSPDSGTRPGQGPGFTRMECYGGVNRQSINSMKIHLKMVEFRGSSNREGVRERIFLAGGWSRGAPSRHWRTWKKPFSHKLREI